MRKKYQSSFVKKNVVGLIIILLTIGGLGIAMILQSSVVNFLPSADNRQSSEFHRAQCVKTSMCASTNLSTEQKDKCYNQCNSVANASKKQIDINFAKQSHKAFIDHFVGLYGRTNYGDWRRTAIVPETLDSTYQRVVCNTVTAAVFKNMLDGKQNNDAEYTYQGDRLMSVMDDYKTWSSGNAKWTAGINAYTCLVASSLMWDKLPNTTDWDRDYIASISNTNRNTVVRTADNKRSDLRRRFEEVGDMILRDYTVDYFKNTQKKRLEKSATSGDSVAEEAGWNGAYLALAAETLPLNEVKKDQYRAAARELLWFSMERASITNDFPVSKDGFVINHNMSPNPQYGFSILDTTARASLAQFKFNNNDRNAVSGEYRRFDRGNNVFTWVDIFETQLSMVDKRDFTLRGKTCLYNNKNVCTNFEDVVYKLPPYEFKGVSDWGTGIWFQNSAFAFSYVIDLYDSNGYRSVDSPYSALLTYQRAKADARQLNLPSVYRDGKWYYEPLDQVKSTAGIKDIRDTEFSPLHSNTDEMTRRHFFLNSEAAFEDVLSYLYIDSNTWLHKLN